jgi:hypothetical protein
MTGGRGGPDTRAAFVEHTQSELRRRVAESAERVLRGNWREGHRRDGVSYAFTCPATPRYRHQW